MRNSVYRATICGIVLLYLSLSYKLIAQSTEELENQILFGSGGYQSPPSQAPVDSNQINLPSDVAVDPYFSRKSKKKSEPIRYQSKKAKKITNSDELDELFFGPKQIPNSHIMVVQRRYIKKAGRHELTPLYLGAQWADLFRRQMQWGFSYAYHFTEQIGIEALHVSMLTQLRTDEDLTVFNYTGLIVDRRDPSFTVGASLLWTPLSSKTATKDSVDYFEGYFLAGGGALKDAREFAPMAMAGLGFRYYISRNSMIKGEFRNYFDMGEESTYRPNIILGWSLLFGGGR